MVHGQNHWPFHHAKQIYFDLNLIYHLLIIRYTFCGYLGTQNPPPWKEKPIRNCGMIGLIPCGCVKWNFLPIFVNDVRPIFELKEEEELELFFPDLSMMPGFHSPGDKSGLWAQALCPADSTSQRCCRCTCMSNTGEKCKKSDFCFCSEWVSDSFRFGDSYRISELCELVNWLPGFWEGCQWNIFK